MMTTYNPRILSISDHYARAWLKAVYRDIHRNHLGYFAANVGKGGMGKSITTNTLNYILDMEYSADSLDDFWCWDILKYLRRIDENEKRMITFDDAGTSRTLSSKNYAKLGNILVEDTTQVMRIKYNGTTIISQNISFVDKRVRSLFHWMLETRRIESNPPFIMVQRVYVNQKTQELFYPYPMMRMPNKRTVMFTGFVMKAFPPGDIRRKFEELERVFKDRILKEDAKRAEQILKEEEPRDIWKMIDEVKADMEKFSSNKGKLDLNLIMLHLEIGRSEAAKIYNYIQKTI